MFVGKGVPHKMNNVSVSISFIQLEQGLALEAVRGNFNSLEQKAGKRPGATSQYSTAKAIMKNSLYHDSSHFRVLPCSGVIITR